MSNTKDKNNNALKARSHFTYKFEPGSIDEPTDFLI